MGIPLDGPANVFCDNEAVVTNTSRVESTLKKKDVAICYHRVREASAMGMIQIATENTDTNLSDCLTKILSGQRTIRIEDHVSVSRCMLSTRYVYLPQRLEEVCYVASGYGITFWFLSYRSKNDFQAKTEFERRRNELRGNLVRLVKRILLLLTNTRILRGLQKKGVKLSIWGRLTLIMLSRMTSLPQPL
jgi:hypothetical protein